MDFEPLPPPEVGERWESFRHFTGRITKVENGGTRITWQPEFWGHARTYGISMFRELFKKLEDSPPE